MSASPHRHRLAVAGATGLIGSQVVELARGAGHEVLALSRSGGVDLTDPEAIGDRLDDVDAVVDVTRSPTMDRQGAVDFFTTVAGNLGRAARAASIPNTSKISTHEFEYVRLKSTPSMHMTVFRLTPSVSNTHSFSVRASMMPEGEMVILSCSSKNTGVNILHTV